MQKKKKTWKNLWQYSKDINLRSKTSWYKEGEKTSNF